MQSDRESKHMSPRSKVGLVGTFFIAILCLLTYFLDYGLLDVLGPIAAGVGVFALVFMVASRLLPGTGSVSSFLLVLFSGAVGGAVGGLVGGRGALLGSAIGTLAALVLGLSSKGVSRHRED